MAVNKSTSIDGFSTQFTKILYSLNLQVIKPFRTELGNDGDPPEAAGHPSLAPTFSPLNLTP